MTNLFDVQGKVALVTGGWDEAWSVNVKALVRLVQELLPQLTTAAHPGDPARVIALGSSDGSRVPEMDVYAYGASKAGTSSSGGSPRAQTGS